ncbi:hypothetical protein T02_3948 [Trichinella nativa]|uniref:Uncharacterized protein n=1 Tax=Trichinella nativa TaxID=6335 RepID=A0A0V1LUQ5_9BILA|nr:hypothetical protein T02_3948 [Trichinella nativa]
MRAHYLPLFGEQWLLAQITPAVDYQATWRSGRGNGPAKRPTAQWGKRRSKDRTLAAHRQPRVVKIGASDSARSPRRASCHWRFALAIRCVADTGVLDIAMGSAAAERERNAAKARSNDRRRGFEKEQRLKPTTNSRTRRSTCAQRITPVFAYPYNVLLIAWQPSVREIVPENHLPTRFNKLEGPNPFWGYHVGHCYLYDREYARRPGYRSVEKLVGIPRYSKLVLVRRVQLVVSCGVIEPFTWPCPNTVKRIDAPLVRRIDDTLNALVRTVVQHTGPGV